ncbi:hypothetical protein [Bradyrhizobium sp. 76]|uniref:hypothetical protein n=1 Tax=Bradyrhizobium sp. 76 TaxID=2782680 RepID=UPI001FFC25EC|nr:hypothetical protein [Bradyrhizobium sp. 76]MCK1404912.1 hypothetical protein [Bradyrhizobium sp. 76]
MNQYNPDLQMFIHSVLVGSPDMNFNVPRSPSFNWVEYTFAKFKVVILSTSFQGVPSHVTGTFIYPFSVDSQKERFNPDTKAIVDELVKGQSAATCVQEFWYGANCLMEAFTLDRLEEHQVMPPDFKLHLENCLKLFSTAADSYERKLRPALILAYRDRRRWHPILQQALSPPGNSRK